MLAGILVVTAVLQIAGLLPKFGTSTIDRSQPAVLQAVRDLSQYHAAAGDYQVVVDIEKDVAWVPSSIAGERTLFVAAGSIDAFIDFGKLADGNIIVSEDRTSVELRLPQPQLAKPNLDNTRSYVFSQERGLLDTLGALVEPPQQQQFYVAAEQKITEAAQRSGLTERARNNTRAMLTGMMTALGYRVTFQETAPHE
ncbi:DUF4230 domain-containing protein [Kibdelosporangium philippinense]|uniref:DUF4230 domain-containing protein n=2 Tax=Kibdelosporangium philippinense TaxID=211113 RepID=A0ABS8ZV38_9PSEU|nr:DUF4230 domain-containing protein [Kibdelosporangium philippinense]MCE7011595.1 DUF4230 domain-containing protein [Kibdelosporangium philippinense]